MSDRTVTLKEIMRYLQHPGIDDPVFLAFWLGMPLAIAWWVELRYWPRERFRPATQRGLLLGMLVSALLAGLLYAYLYEALRSGLIHCVSRHACRWKCDYGDAGCALIKPARGRASMALTPVPFWSAYVFLSAFLLVPLLAWFGVCLKAFRAWSRMPWRVAGWSGRN